MSNNSFDRIPRPQGIETSAPVVRWGDVRVPAAGLKAFHRLVFLANLQEHVIFRNMPQDIRQVLFVCRGNICRSPLAESYFQARLDQLGRPVTTRSAGLDTTAGKSAHPMAKAVARRHGFSLEAHSTTRLSQELVDKADVILVMEYAHAWALRRWFMRAQRKVFLLGDFNGGSPLEIADPFSGTSADFETCYLEIRACCDNLIGRLSGRL